MIDWKLNDLDFALESDDDVLYLEFKPKLRDGVYYTNGYGSFNRDSWKLKTRPQPKSWNGEGLPPVGTKCLINFTKDNRGYEEGTINYIGERCVCFDTDYGKEQFEYKSQLKFKPLDTRTDEQKAIDDMVDQLKNEGIILYDPIMLKVLIEKFKANKVSGIKFTK